MAREARAKRAIAMTNGWADCRPIFVAADADAQRTAKIIPARKDRNCLNEVFNAVKLVARS